MPITDELKALLLRHFESIEQLLVLMHIAQAPTPATAESVAEKLRIHKLAAEDALLHLVRQGFMTQQGDTFHYQPQSPAFAAFVTSLPRAYEDNTLEIIKLMTAHAIDRLRDSTARAFADAFIVRRKKNDS